MLLSAVLITKNRPASVQRLIDSLAVQSLHPDEVIIINDGGERISLNTQGLKTHTIHHQKSIGPAGSRNEGVKKASGDLILMLDDDVELQGVQFIKESAALFQDSKVGIVFPRKIDVISDKSYEYSYFEHSRLTGETKVISHERMRKSLEKGNAVLGPMVYMTRKEAYLKIGGHSAIFGYGIGHSFREESDFQLRLQEAGYQVALATNCIFKHHIQAAGGHGSAVNKKLFWIGHNQVVYRFRHSKMALIENLFFAIIELPRYSWVNGRLLSYPAGLLGMIAGVYSAIRDSTRKYEG